MRKNYRKIVAMISRIVRKIYTENILAGKLTGSKLLAKMRARLSGASMDKVSSTLMWHMAHCPRPEDRQRVAELSRQAGARLDNLMIPTSDFETANKVYTCFRSAMLMRNRGIFLPEFPTLSLLLLNPHSFSFSQLSDSENIFTFGVEVKDQAAQLSLFVKNNWPLGYAIARPAVICDARTVFIGFHIFPEFRGTSSTVAFFNAFIKTTKETHAPEYIFIPMQSDDPAFAGPTDLKKAARFFKRFGFRWTDRERIQMYKN